MRRFRLTPTVSSFDDLFATSASHLVEGARELTNLLGVDRSERETVAARMRDIEHAADESTHAIMRKVNSSFITPFDREDIYGLAPHLDDCMDLMEAAADLIVLYRIGDLPDGIAAQVEILVRMAELTAETMPRFRSMHDLAEYWIEINRLETRPRLSPTRSLPRSRPGRGAGSVKPRRSRRPRWPSVTVFRTRARPWGSSCWP